MKHGAESIARNLLLGDGLVDDLLWGKGLRWSALVTTALVLPERGLEVVKRGGKLGRWRCECLENVEDSVVDEGQVRVGDRPEGQAGKKAKEEGVSVRLY